MTTPSDTPRTDALVRFEFESTDHPFPAHALLAMMQLAKELERELSALREQLAEARNATVPGSAAIYAKLEQQLAEREATITNITIALGAYRASEAERDAELAALKGHADDAVPIVEHFCSRNPCWTNGIGPTQDPLGAHAWLSAYRAAYPKE